MGIPEFTAREKQNCCYISKLFRMMWDNIMILMFPKKLQKTREDTCVDLVMFGKLLLNIIQELSLYSITQG